MKRKESYLDYYSKQSTNRRFRLNELVIWAVNKIEDTHSNIYGSKMFLEKRMDQLVKDCKFEKWRDASNRFRSALNQWVSSYRVDK